MSKYITAKDLSRELEMNERTFRQPRKIKELGLIPALDPSCKHRIRFLRIRARIILVAQGIEVGF